MEKSTAMTTVHKAVQLPGELVMNHLKQSLSVLLSFCLILTAAPGALAYQSDQPPAQATVQAAKQSPAQLQQLVAPIALYPDSLVAQILAAATYPDQVVEADRWMQQNTSLKGKQLGEAVDKQSWDPSIKALTEFPSVLGNMDKNLSWTSSVGDAYVNQPQDVMKAVQVMRQRAKNAGNLNSSSQEKVSEQGQTIVIEPANSQVVYVPQYDPWLVYGAPIAVWPGWYDYPGLFLAGPGIEFGVGFGIGFFGGFGWGWHHWGSDWHHHNIVFDHHSFVSHSRTFFNHDAFNRGRGGFNYRQPNFGHGAAGGRQSFHAGAERGSTPHGSSAMGHQSGLHSSAFSGFDHGGSVRGISARGHASMGGGFHGGGGHGGGRR
jgi:uncharacterized membrane protein YgcG